jgi:hypothetical protein
MIICLCFNLEKKDNEIKDFIKFTLHFKNEEILISKIKKRVNFFSQNVFKVEAMSHTYENSSLTNFEIQNQTEYNFELNSFKLNGFEKKSFE